jgi:hypothetical protein
MGLSKPTKIGGAKKPVVLYSVEQVDLRCQLKQLTEWFNLAALRRFVAKEEPLDR